MMNSLFLLLKSMRPTQWLKNFTLFVALFFSGKLLEKLAFIKVSKGFIIFCGITSAMYLINDIVDREKDRVHPLKKFRPIASGKLSKGTALVLALFLLAISLSAAFFLSEYFFAVSLAYTATMLSYSLLVKNIILLDALFVAFGFVYRVWAGALVAGLYISSWLIICTTTLALLISFGRRRCEITLLEAQAPQHRQVLEFYPTNLLDVIITIVTSVTLISYFLYTFLAPIPKVEFFWTKYLPGAWRHPKWLMATIPIVLYGVLRYLYLIYERKDARSVEEIVFYDKPLLLSITLWVFSVFAVIYVLG